MSSILKTIRGKIMAGLVTIAPIAATFYVLTFLFNIFDNFPYLDKIIPIQIPGLGIIISLIVLFLLGLLVTNFLGKKLIGIGEMILRRIPIANTIYGAAKQITQAFGGSKSKAFQKTVLIPYPHKGIWTLAFVTGESTDRDENEYYHVFVSTTPNPTSGFMLIVPKEDTFDANMTVEHGLKAIISGGMLAPDRNQITFQKK